MAQDPEIRWCWWPVDHRAGIGDIACGLFATAKRVHPVSHEEVYMCNEHTEQFDFLVTQGAY